MSDNNLKSGTEPAEARLIVAGESKNGSIQIERYPSDDYHAHTDSLGYRLSELVFGSLLVAYVTGFLWVAFSNPCINQKGLWDWSAFYTLFNAVCLSVSFGMITAALYVSYHFGVLTMPVPASGKLGRDFLLAISQVGFYGLALIWPNLTLFWLAISMLPVLERHRTFSIQLAQAAIRLASRSQLIKGEHPRGDDPHAQKSINDANGTDQLRRGLERIKDKSNRSTYAAAWSSWYPATFKDWLVVFLLAVSSFMMIFIIVHLDGERMHLDEEHKGNLLLQYLFQNHIQANHQVIIVSNILISLLIALKCRSIIDVKTILIIPKRTQEPGFDENFAFDQLWTYLVHTFADNKSDKL